MTEIQTKRPKYRTIQIVLKEKFIGIGNKNLSEIDDELNAWYEKGYRLHTISTTCVDSKGFGGGDRTIATCVLERID